MSQNIGPLANWEGIRQAILDEVAHQSLDQLASGALDLVLGEALYSERIRMKREKPGIFNRSRFKRDRALWNQVQAGLVKPAAEVDRRELLARIIRHYVEEIGGHFDPSVYEFATRAVPFGFSWLLNAASVRNFLPWRMSESLQSRIKITGEVAWLKSLSEKGTILLVPTHQSNIDSVLIGYIIYLMGLPPFAYGAGLNLFSNPALSYFMSRLGAYTVDRKKVNAIYKLVLKDYSTRILRAGIHSVFFPGGGRSRSGALESRVKLGLLGTGLEAQLENLRQGVPLPSVFIVPMTTSYHFVLEAGSLIEDHLVEAGKHRFIILDDEAWQPLKVLRFFWKFFSSQSEVVIRVGKPLDIFGNFVDDGGRSIGPNSTLIDPRCWLTTRGELRPLAQRDHEYTRELGGRIVERFHKENTVLSSHLLAFAFFETLRAKYPDLDLYRFLRISIAQRSLPCPDFLAAAERFHLRVKALADRGELYLADELKTGDTASWVKNAIRHLGAFHDVEVLRLEDDVIWAEDMNLLYYYRNRLSGYGISALKRVSGDHDAKGFLA